MSTIPVYRYLVVEDEGLIRRNLIKKINSLNLPLELVGEASNGMDAHILIDKCCPHLVITDIRMPQYDGLSLARHLHKNYPDIKTIILSGYDDFSYAQTAIQYEVKDYLLKPVTVDALSKSLHKILIIMDSENAKQDAFFADSAKLDQKSICELLENYLQKNYKNEISIGGLAEKFGFTQEYLSRIFKKYTSETPSKYLIRLRMNEAKRLLHKSPDLEIQKIGEMVGYKDGFYFSRAFKSYTGMGPTEYRMNIL